MLLDYNTFRGLLDPRVIRRIQLYCNPTLGRRLPIHSARPPTSYESMSTVYVLLALINSSLW